MTALEFLFKQPEYMDVSFTSERSIFYHVAPDKYVSLMERYAKHRERHNRITLLEKYTLFLQDNGYIDTDATSEEPYAIDEFLKQQK